MRSVRERPHLTLVGLGGLAILLSYTAGNELFHGYAKSGGGYLLHAGMFAVISGVSATVFSNIDEMNTTSKAFASMTVAFILLYPIALGFIWYDIIITPPPNYGANPSLFDLAIDRLGFVLSLSPLGAGYVLGAYKARPSATQRKIPVLTLFLVLCASVLAYGIALLNGGHPGFTLLFYAMLTGVGILGSIPFYVVAKARFGNL